MKLKEPKITILIGEESTKIEIRDGSSRVVFCTIDVDPINFQMALSRIAERPCEVTVKNLDKIGKKKESKSIRFELPKDFSTDKDNLKNKAEEYVPEGWEIWNGFSSQNTIVYNDGKKFCNFTIRRYV